MTDRAGLREAADWWTDATKGVIRNAFVDGKNPSEERWVSAIMGGILRAYNRGRDAAPSQREALAEGARKMEGILSEYSERGEMERPFVISCLDWQRKAVALTAAPSQREALPAELREAASKLLDKLDLVGKATHGMFVLAHVHGASYSGPNWTEEYNAVRAALARAG